MGRLLTGIAGALGLAWLWRFLRREQAQQHPRPEPGTDPAEELRARLAEAREAADDRDDYDAAEGQPVDEVERPPHAAAEPVPEAEPDEPTLSLDERRRAIHEKAQQALGEMNRPGQGD
jgi:hypothetical protein